MPRIYIKRTSEVKIVHHYYWHCPLCNKSYEFPGDEYNKDDVENWKKGHFSKKHNLDVPLNFYGKFNFKEGKKNDT